MTKKVIEKHIIAISVLVILFLSPHLSYGQKSTVGLKIGGNFSTFKGGLSNIYVGDVLVPLVGFGRRFGFNIGLSTEHHLIKQIAIRSDFTYMRKGASIESSVDIINGGNFELDDSHYRIDYLDLLAAIKFIPIKTKDYRPYVFFGPSFGVSFNSKVKVQDLSSSGVEKKWDINISIGLGISYNLDENSHLSIEIHYSKSISDNEIGRSGSFRKTKLYNESIITSLVYHSTFASLF